jgi:protein tyrosine/serine phosphatase
MKALETLGVRTIINLRGFHSDRDEIKDTSLTYRRIQFHTWHAEDEDVIEFLRIVSKPENQPVFVHCLHGADRTGTMCAIYRMAVDGWTVEAAIQEMTDGGFGYHEIWSNLPVYLRQLDVAKIRKAAGLDQ